eukprot:238917_1
MFNTFNSEGRMYFGEAPHKKFEPTHQHNSGYKYDQSIYNNSIETNEVEGSNIWNMNKNNSPQLSVYSHRTVRKLKITKPPLNLNKSFMNMKINSNYMKRINKNSTEISTVKPYRTKTRPTKIQNKKHYNNKTNSIKKPPIQKNINFWKIQDLKQYLNENKEMSYYNRLSFIHRFFQENVQKRR